MRDSRSAPTRCVSFASVLCFSLRVKSAVPRYSSAWKRASTLAYFYRKLITGLRIFAQFDVFINASGKQRDRVKIYFTSPVWIFLIFPHVARAFSALPRLQILCKWAEICSPFVTGEFDGNRLSDKHLLAFLNRRFAFAILDIFPYDVIEIRLN